MQDGKAYTTTLKLKLLKENVAKEESYMVDRTCLLSMEASREIVCERNYIEASDPGGARDGHAAVFLISGYIPLWRNLEADRVGNLWTLKGCSSHFQVSLKKAVPSEHVLPEEHASPGNANQVDLRRSSQACAWRSIGIESTRLISSPHFYPSMHNVRLVEGKGYQV